MYNKQAASRLFFAVVLFCCLNASISAQNNQKIIPIDSEIYQAIKSLYISQGLALPSTAGPWSEAELFLMLDRIDISRLQGATLRAYDFAYEKLAKEDSPLFKFSGALNAELY